MKKKYVGCIGLLTAAILACSGCGEKAQEQSKMDAPRGQMQEDENMVYGEVKSVDADRITIEVGNRKQPQQKGEDSSSMLELTGEEKEIAITEDTEIVRRSMGGRGNGGMSAVSISDIEEGDVIAVSEDEEEGTKIIVMSPDKEAGEDSQSSSEERSM